jgi:parvulin-like peptidyl-prolyl isomerase
MKDGSEMSDSKKSPEKWRAEALRDQRKARLASMKSKDGGKKPISTTNKTGVLVMVIILVVALIGTGVWWVVNMGVPQRLLTAMTIGSRKISVTEFNYYYRSQLSYYSIDPATTDGKTTLAQAYDKTYPTVADYLKNQATLELQQVVLLKETAAAAGVVLDAADQKTIDSYVSSIESSALSASQTVDNYLIAQYGIGMNVSIMRGILEDYVLTGKYSKQLQDSYTFTDAELQTFYDANKNDYDVIDYRTFNIAAVIASGATEAEKTAAMDAAKAKADEMFAKITDETSFKEQCIAYAADDAAKTAYTTTDKSLVKDAFKSTISSTDQAAWLFDTARKSGDKTVIKADTGYFILYFAKRSIAGFQHVSVRHILIPAAKDTATEDQIAKAKTKAESILAGYLAGEKTEDAFAVLANANSTDTGSNTTGGLYANISPLDSYVAEFKDWCFADGRKTGDTGIVQTTYGFHIMYFVGVDGIDWKIKVKATMVSEKYNAFLKEKAANFPYVQQSLGMRLVG